MGKKSKAASQHHERRTGKEQGKEYRLDAGVCWKEQRREQRGSADPPSPSSPAVLAGGRIRSVLELQERLVRQMALEEGWD